MYVLQCLQSCRNGKRGVMIYSHFAAHHRHYVWTPLYLICLSFSCLPHLHPPLRLSSSFVCLSSLTPYLLPTPFSHPIFLPQTWLYCINEMPHFQLSSLILSDPWRRQVCLLTPYHQCSSPSTFSWWGPRISWQKRWGNHTGGKVHWWIPALWASFSLCLAVEELWWGHDPLEVYKAKNGRQRKTVSRPYACLVHCWDHYCIQSHRHTATTCLRITQIPLIVQAPLKPLQSTSS